MYCFSQNNISNQRHSVPQSDTSGPGQLARIMSSPPVSLPSRINCEHRYGFDIFFIITTGITIPTTTTNSIVCLVLLVVLVLVGILWFHFVVKLCGDCNSRPSQKIKNWCGITDPNTPVLPFQLLAILYLVATPVVPRSL